MNQEAYDTLWYWVNERHRIYQKKEAGEPKPWSNDPIFQQWKFCNVFRQLDTQTHYLIDSVLNPYRDWISPETTLFNIFVFRAFNWWKTYDYLITAMNAHGCFRSWDGDKAKDALYAYLSEENTQLSSGAYMLRGREGMPKYESIIQTLTSIWNTKEVLAEELELGNTMYQAYSAINEQGFWGWGPFTIYQVVLDLTYTPILQNASDINTWCEFGPGAIRGLQEIWPDIKKNEYLDAARDLYVDSFKHLEPHMPNMTLQDIEFSLCELGKYLRIKRGGKGKMKYAGI